MRSNFVQTTWSEYDEQDALQNASAAGHSRIAKRQTENEEKSVTPRQVQQILGIDIHAPSRGRGYILRAPHIGRKRLPRIERALTCQRGSRAEMQAIYLKRAYRSEMAYTIQISHPPHVHTLIQQFNQLLTTQSSFVQFTDTPSNAGSVAGHAFDQ
jgi:hypothetical protein